MNIDINKIINNAFVKLKGKKINKDKKKYSKKWVELLSSELRDNYNDLEKYRVFSKYYPCNRKDFKLNEFLFDIHVCEIAKQKSLVKNTEIVFIKKSIWQIESEFDSHNSRELSKDFSKLVTGNAKNKMFITKAKEEKKGKIKDYLANIAINCCGEIYLVILVEKSEKQPYIFNYKNNKWNLLK